MCRKSGFTLIELLIVVAIIGILTALLIPNALTAIQKSKQKSTMKDIMTISTAMIDHITDNAVLPAHSGTYTNTDEIYTSLSPLYVKVMPVIDMWNNGYVIFTRDSVSGQWGAGFLDGSANWGNDEFLIGSYGRDGEFSSEYTFDPADPTSGFYTIANMPSFDYDLVAWGGSWIVCAEGNNYNITGGT